MKITNSTPVFNPFNNSWVYVCFDEGGVMWVRSSTGRWARIEQPLDTFSVGKDFETFTSQGGTSTPEDLKTENKGDVVVPVMKVEYVPPPIENPPPAPAEDPTNL